MNKPKYLATGIRLGLIEPSEIQAWVNAEIAKSDEPSDGLLNLAYAKDNDIHEMYSTLLGLADDSDEYEIVRILLSEIEQEKLESIDFCWRLTECLYTIWVEHDYSAPDDLSAIGFLEDEYRMASNGTMGTIEGWHADFKDFVSGLEKSS